MLVHTALLPFLLDKLSNICIFYMLNTITRQKHACTNIHVGVPKNTSKKIASNFSAVWQMTKCSWHRCVSMCSASLSASASASQSVSVSACFCVCVCVYICVCISVGLLGRCPLCLYIALNNWSYVCIVVQDISHFDRMRLTSCMLLGFPKNRIFV